MNTSFRPHLSPLLLPMLRPVALAVGLLCLASAHAQNADEPAALTDAGALSPMVVTAERASGGVWRGAGSVDVVEGDALREGHADQADRLLQTLRDGAALAADLGLEVHAGHGIDYETVTAIAAIPQVVELNIGHFLIGEAIFVGLGEAMAKMRGLMQAARAAS